MAQITLFVTPEELDSTHEQMQRRMRFVIPVGFWHPIRFISVGLAFALCLILLIRPELGLRLFWGAFIPIAPLIFFIIPGLWRNICPLAAMNQAPRWFGLTRNQFATDWPVPHWLKNYSYPIGITMLLLLISSRKVILNTNGLALASFIFLVLVIPFIMGFISKGKSGWCSSICPMLPVERIYGQTPFITLPNSHCQPCVDCTSKCYDKQPHSAYLKDLYADDPHHVAYRKFFVGLFPGFIYGFYTVPAYPAIGLLHLYTELVVYSVLSLVSFYILDNFLTHGPLKLTATRSMAFTPNILTATYGMVAFNLYYAFTPQAAAHFWDTSLPMWLTLPFEATIFALSAVWLYRTAEKEQLYRLYFLPPQDVVKVTFGELTISAPKDVTLLSLAKKNNVPLKYSCEGGTCEADPVCVFSGMENLSEMGAVERATLEKLDRIGTARITNTRLACMAKVLRGQIIVGLTPEPSKSSILVKFESDPTIKSVVIIGNGIAGYQAAYEVYRRHRQCDIYLIGDENHLTYQRISIAKLISEPKLVQDLYLKAEDWYEARRITLRTKEQVIKVDTATQMVILNTGETLPYDRLIFATGSQSRSPSTKDGRPIAGFELAGTFNLYKVQDSINIQAFVQTQRPRRAIVFGGGVTAMEVAYELHKLGQKTNMQVTLISRSGLMQLDKMGEQILVEHLEKIGFKVQLYSDVVSLYGQTQVQEVTLKSGENVPCDLFVACIGVMPNITLAKETGLKVKRGIVVDDEMRTSIPNIFAVGDVAEHDNLMPQLVDVAKAQAEVSAVNAVRGNEIWRQVYTRPILSVKVKISAFDLYVINGARPQHDNEQNIILKHLLKGRYAKLSIANGRLLQGILLQATAKEVQTVTEAIRQEIDISCYLPELERGNWDVLSRLTE